MHILYSLYSKSVKFVEPLFYVTQLQKRYPHTPSWGLVIFMPHARHNVQRLVHTDWLLLDLGAIPQQHCQVVTECAGQATNKMIVNTCVIRSSLILNMWQQQLQYEMSTLVPHFEHFL
jgi:hypothetical protein